MPRLILIIIFVMTDWFKVFDTWLWPLLGTLFFPYTTLAYMASKFDLTNSIGWGMVVMFALIVDILEYCETKYR